LLYANTFNHQFVLDDTSAITENTLVKKGILGISQIWTKSYMYGFSAQNDESYRPLPLTIFAILFECFEASPTPFHIFSIVAYALLLVVLYYYLLNLFNNNKLLVAAMVLVFAVHPIHTEVVSNVKSLDEILAMFFSVLAFNLHLSYEKHRKFPKLFLALGSFLIALFSKEVAITVLPVFVFQLYVFKSATVKKALLKGAVFAVPLIIYFTIRFLVLDSIGFDESNEKLAYYNNGLLITNSFVDQTTTAIVILGFYLKQLSFPFEFSYDYSYAVFPITNWLSAKFLVTLVLYLSLIVFAIRELKNKSPLGFAILLFLMPLSIYSNVFVKIAATAGDRFLFFPSLGFVMLVLLIPQKKNLPIKSLSNTSKGALLTVIAGILAFVTISRNLVWENEEMLFLTDVKTQPNSFRTQLFAASVFTSKGDKSTQPQIKKRLYIKAQNHLETAFEILPQYPDIRIQLLQNYRSLSLWEKMQPLATKSIDKFPENTDLLFLYGEAFMYSSEYNKSIQAFKQLLTENDPKHRGSSWYNLGAINLNHGNYSQSIVQFTKAIEQKTNVSNATYYLAIAEFQASHYELSLGHFLKIKTTDPNYAHSQSSIGTIYLIQEEFELALTHLQNAIKYSPGNKNILNNMAVAYEQLGQPEKALEAIGKIKN
jgi:tetratricopeptide (TPR) repeat protein